MPLRTMIYDALGYLKKYQDITRKRKKEKKETQEEFLSNMKKDDRLHPIITIVIYYGETLWDGPFSLGDMMIEMPQEIKDIFIDYRMNLLQVRDSSQYIFQNGDVQTVFEISRESELLTVIGKITDSKAIIKQGLESKEGVNMCKALENLENQGKQKGIEEGKLEAAKVMIENGMDLEFVAEKLNLKKELVENFMKNTKK